MIESAKLDRVQWNIYFKLSYSDWTALKRKKRKKGQEWISQAKRIRKALITFLKTYKYDIGWENANGTFLKQIKIWCRSGLNQKS